MRIQLALLLATFAVTAQPAAAQRPKDEQKRPEAKRAHPPPAPPAPARRPRQDARPEPERGKDGHQDDRPHANNRHWYGHATPNDARFRLEHPFEHGRFARIGPSYRYRVVRFDRDLHRLWIPGGFYFEIAPWDRALVNDWCWDCNADDFVVYRDPDHVGWYLLYNARTNGYVHVQYLGA